MGRGLQYHDYEEDIFSYKEKYYKKMMENTAFDIVICRYCNSKLTRADVVDGKCPNCTAPVKQKLR